MKRSFQTVLITGGSSGIGLEFAKLFAADDYHVVLVARGKQELENTADELHSLGMSSRSARGRREIPSDTTETREVSQAARHDGAPSVITIPADLSDPAAPQRLVEQLAKQNITIDVLVNNAGYGLLGSFADADEAATIGMIQLNITALTELTKRLLPGMIKRKHGRILNVASTAAFQPGPFMAVYYATKAYVLSFSEALQEELRGTGVTVTTLCPGPTATNFQIRAFIQSVALFRVGVMSAADVARVGYAALMRGQRLIIPGLRNVLGVFLIRFAPRALVLHLIRSLQTQQNS